MAPDATGESAQRGACPTFTAGSDTSGCCAKKLHQNKGAWSKSGGGQKLYAASLLAVCIRKH